MEKKHKFGQTKREAWPPTWIRL